MKTIRSLALATAVSVCATGALASTVKVTYSSSYPSTLITISGTEVVGGSANALAGAFNMTGSEPSDASVPSNVIGSFIAWCLDAGAYLNTGTGTYTVNPETVFAAYDVNTTAVERYFDANFTDTIHLDATRAAAFQVGLWQTIYTGIGQFSYSGANATDAFTALVDGFVADGLAYSDDRIWTLTYLESSSHQSLVTATPIPLPATGFLMLGVMGLGGIGVMARRRRDKAA